MISIHALREESDDTWDGAETFDRISIHALREESDMDPPTLQQMVRISIHTPLAGSDQNTAIVDSRKLYFNPHSPCGE